MSISVSPSVSFCSSAGVYSNSRDFGETSGYSCFSSHHHPRKVASTGDDLTARVWTLKNPSGLDDSSPRDDPAPRAAPPRDDPAALAATPEMSAFFPLGSPGVALGWHPDDPAKLMVAERAGVVRFYNVSNQQVGRENTTVLRLYRCIVYKLKQIKHSNLRTNNH